MAVMMVLMSQSFMAAQAEEGPEFRLRIVGSEVVEAPAKAVLPLDQSFKLDILMDTKGQQIDAANVMVTYDPLYFQAVAGDGKAAVSALPGQVFNLYPSAGNTIADGVIRVTGLNGNGSPFSGRGIFASVWFKPLKSTGSMASVFFSIDFLEGETRDSNMAFQGVDLLKAVYDLPVNVGASTPGAPVVGATSEGQDVLEEISVFSRIWNSLVSLLSHVKFW